jgi:hypothetical protein
MWDTALIGVIIDDAEGDEVIVRFVTPVGTLEVVASVGINERILYVKGAHAQGLKSGALGRAGLNAICRSVLEVADVDQLVIQGGTRTTGCNRGRPPKSFRFPHDSVVTHKRTDPASS